MQDAIPYLEQIIEKQPENAEIAYALGVSYIQTRQPEKARRTFSYLFGVPANSASAYMINGKMHVRQRFEETAVIELNKALELDRKTSRSSFYFG